VIDCIVGKSLLAVKRTELRRLCVGGGVAANRKLRKQLTDVCTLQRIELHIADPKLCTDNAVMGALAWERYQAGDFDLLDLDAQPGLLRHRN
jgi:N6-L-threonylcarbamoyladenine synthase